VRSEQSVKGASAAGTESYRTLFIRRLGAARNTSKKKNTTNTTAKTTTTPPGSAFDYHKNLLPMDNTDYLCFFLSSLGLIIAAGGGIGGGGILVPMLMIVLKWKPKHAIALSNITICGGSIANCLFNVPKVLPDGRPYIDWDIILIMEPSTIVGAILGSFASKYLPDFVLTVMLAVILSMLAFRTMEKGVKMFVKENDSMESDSDESPLATPNHELKELTNPKQHGFRVLGQDDHDSVNGSEEECSSEEEPEGDPAPWYKIFLLVVSWAGCLVFTVLKGNGQGSIIGVTCGSTLFWILSFSSIPWVILFGIYFRNMLIYENKEKVRSGAEFKEGDITWDGRTTIIYPLVCTIAGVFAGLFGVGGGIVKGPLMLEMGVLPVIASATAATMILFTSSAACLSFYLFGMLPKQYAYAYFVLGFVCTAVGQAAVNQWMKTAKRQSPPVLSIGLVLALSTIMVTFKGYLSWIAAYNQFGAPLPYQLFQPSSLCA